jgi:hypothetical protein
MDEKKAPQQRREALEQIRSQHSDNSVQSQASRMEAALRELGSITTFEASRALDIYHPPARALSLRKRGLNIITMRERVVTESGKLHNVGRYVLATETEAGCHD